MHRILALNSYQAGSHEAFLKGWMAHTRHCLTPLALPGHHWKWRMRHAAATFAQQTEALEGVFDAVWCTSMLDLAAFRGLAPASIAGLPCHLYFHENQLTYPDRRHDPRDHHFAITHLTSVLAAVKSGGTVTWNSAFNRDSFLVASRKMLKKMPGHELDSAVDLIEAVSGVASPGVEVPARSSTLRRAGPLRVVWAARWEHDKDPDAFFAALKALKKRGVDFRLSVVGESFEQVPECFAVAQRRFADHIDHWGFLPSREDYMSVLHDADVFVSTARHEFFGLSVVEAVAAGCFPVLPHRLAYPEVFGEREDFYYDGTPAGLCDRLAQWAANPPAPVCEGVEEYAWAKAAAVLDERVE